MESNVVTISALVDAPIDTVWKLWTDPDHIKQWNHASDDWHTTEAENDLRIDGKFRSRMEAKDQSMAFDFEGVYEEVEVNELIQYRLEDGRRVRISFSSEGDQTKVVEVFDAESMNPVEMQRQGWQAILDNFTRYANGKK
ncbi:MULTISPECIES: SRPBCC family protein [Exiguobacterium]|uniref:Activator of Hsp90 ATPase 1 family protein n=1 Tax=Exiguobacterium sp. (strain ATCC BAA-1283 / AT1b) TaxID=360911 RepID=C4L2M7_EXISA|nr:MULTISPECIES: SRPBCC family protein [unclassified Exiguobacterium]ACQ69285.1 Activator of Hsp90 ATPase 1 family protein [Exiguobacterium sp. AT1b]